ncbi:Uncharacterized ABC transporter ATP-binding protein YufO [[Clostridium] ultunense Esp]|uniref:ABC transporter ATP-binding protein n=1 Tax=Schnuerera ultunensis TaxID=45497 RepID=UPI0002B6FF54|nr:ABC transporter ATP-binding protein [Schnuerera ultunensis]CCQ98067.1 Uncharacterized ABC transporter ATP-binding protein YufO [[Clostridium] ultunense Esp]
MEIIRMEKISKVYPGTVALDGVDFTLNKQEIVSLLGENGAGKTTLMKILYGMTAPSSGKIFYNGEPVRFRRPVDAIEKGICMVHQHFMLVPAFTVVENIIAGSEPGSNVFLDMKKARQEVVDLISKFHFNVDPDVKVEKLSVGEQQRVEILKVLYRKADVIILDEPTAVLTPHEVDDLFAVLRRLKDDGKSIIIITHKLKETKEIADRVVVLRDGHLIADNVDPSKASTKQFSEMMVGREVNLQARRPSKSIGDACLKVSNLSIEEDGKEKVKDVTFDIHHGEILGIAGVEGNGQTQLIEALTGLRKPRSMKLTLNGKEITGKSSDFIKAGIGHVPEDRLLMGLVKEMSVMDNMILGYHRESDFCKKNGLLLQKEISDYAEKLKDDFQVKASSIHSAVSSLSGGNQQKIIISRVFSREPKAIIVAHPTRGVDIGASEYIHEQLIELRNRGAAILLISADLDEVMALSDRILVLYEGQIVSESMPGELSEVEMGLLMTGGNYMVEEGKHHD